MRPVDTKHFTIGPRLTFALLVAVILGGNASSFGNSR